MFEAFFIKIILPELMSLCQLVSLSIIDLRVYSFLYTIDRRDLFSNLN